LPLTAVCGYAAGSRSERRFQRHSHALIAVAVAMGVLLAATRKKSSIAAVARTAGQFFRGT